MAWWLEDEWRRMWDGDECEMCADAPLATNPSGELHHLTSDERCGFWNDVSTKISGPTASRRCGQPSWQSPVEALMLYYTLRCRRSPRTSHLTAGRQRPDLQCRRTLSSPSVDRSLRCRQRMYRAIPWRMAHPVVVLGEGSR